MDYFGKFYKLQTCKRVQRPLVFFKPFEKQVKPRVAHTPKGKKKKKGGENFINVKKKEFGEKIKANFLWRWIKNWWSDLEKLTSLCDADARKQRNLI